MTTKTDFTTEEWDQLLQSPIQIGFYMIFADPSFTGMFKEMKAMFKTILEQPVPDDTQDLVSSLVADIKEKTDNKEQLPGSDNMSKAQFEEVMAEMLEFIKGVAVLLDAKSTRDEAAGFKEWLFGVAKAVSEAAKEGGHLGFGGVRVSDKEESALNKLKFALRM